jgi:predicted permease
MLTVGGGLVLRSFWHLTRVEPGFESRGVLAVSLAFHPARYQELAGVTGLLQHLRARVAGLPGVDAVALSSRLPLAENTGWTSDFAIRGLPVSTTSREIMHREVGPGYFLTMRVPLVSGRDFTGTDRAGAEWVAIINQAMADHHFRGRDPVGEMIAFDRDADSTSIWHRIVGVAGSEHQKSLGELPRPEVFTALEQTPRRGVHVVIRTATDPQLLVPAVEGVISGLDPGMPVLAAVTMDDAKSRSLARERFLATMLLAFAGVGVLLSIVGVYGVVAQLAVRRTNEMHIRIALGAQTSQVRWLVVRHGLTLVGAGVVTGCILSAALGGAVRKLLYGVGPLDPFTFVVMPACLLLTGLAASWIPAVRATRTDPAGALRSE